MIGYITFWNDKLHRCPHMSISSCYCFTFAMNVFLSIIIIVLWKRYRNEWIKACKYTVTKTKQCMLVQYKHDLQLHSQSSTGGVYGSRYLTFCERLCRSLFVDLFLCLFVIVWSVLLRFMASEYPYGIFILSNDNV